MEASDSGSYSSDAERFELDERIRETEATLRRLKNRRNELASIAKIPPELLSRIFLILRDNAINGSRRDNWIKTLHICHYWREVALGCAPLWSVVEVKSLDMMRQCLEWSEQVPIRVIIPSSIAMNVDRLGGIKEVAQSHLHRVQCIEASTTTIFAWYIIMPRFLQAFNNASAPILRTLVLEFGQQQNLAYSDRNIDTFPPSFLNGGTPALRHVRLKGMGLCWSSPRLSGLTSLIVENRKASASSPEDFFDALERMPALTHLEIDNLPNLDQFTGRIPVPMAVLKELQVRTSLKQCVGLLDNIILPISTRVKLSIDMSSIQGNDGDEIEPSLFPPLVAGINKAWLSNPLALPLTPPANVHASSPLTDVSPLDIRAIAIDSPTISQIDEARNPCEAYYTLQAWLHNIDFTRFPAKYGVLSHKSLEESISPPSLTVTIIVQEQPIMPAFILESLIDALPLQKIESIHVGIDGQVSTSAKLTSISVWDINALGYPCSGFFYNLHRWDAHEDEKLLSSLSFEGADFGAVVGENDSEVGPRICWMDFLDFCRTYRDVDDKPIKHIRLVRCTGVTEDEARQLKGIIESVDWVGCDEICSSDSDDEDDEEEEE